MNSFARVRIAAKPGILCVLCVNGATAMHGGPMQAAAGAPVC